MTNDSTGTAIAHAHQALADLYAAAVAALNATERKERVQSAVGKRATVAGAAQAGAELAFAALIAAQRDHKPHGVELVADTTIAGPQATGGKQAIATMTRRIRDNL